MTSPHTSDSTSPDAPVAPLVSEPAGGTPPLTTSVQGVLDWCASVEPDEHLAIDVERASSFRYSARAYLVQIKTQAAGILMFDPLAFQIPPTFVEITKSHPWILHASRQDLPSLAMLGLTPPRLFDTEVAARLLGLPKVGLGSLTEDLLQVRLAKEHSAANWSKRPLPYSWLAYAALDVEYLVELKDTLADQLEAAGKTEWAEQEFAFESGFAYPEPAEEPWRGLNGIGVLRHPKQLAIARAMWEHRDRLAKKSDIAPFMIVRDRDLVAAVKAVSRGRAEFDRALPKTMKNKDQWWQVARSGRDVGTAHLPSSNPRGPFPNPRQWGKKFPETHETYQKLRTGLIERAEELSMPVENLMSPAHVRHWVWDHFGEKPVHSVDSDSVEDLARELEVVGARPWQAEQVAPVIARTFGS